MGFAMLHRHRGPQVPETPEPTKDELVARVRQLENELENLRNAPTEPTDAELKSALEAAAVEVDERRVIIGQQAERIAELEAENVTLKASVAALQGLHTALDAAEQIQGEVLTTEGPPAEGEQLPPVELPPVADAKAEKPSKKAPT